MLRLVGIQNALDDEWDPRTVPWLEPARREFFLSFCSYAWSRSVLVRVCLSLRQGHASGSVLPGAVRRGRTDPSACIGLQPLLHAPSTFVVSQQADSMVPARRECKARNKRENSNGGGVRGLQAWSCPGFSAEEARPDPGTACGAPFRLAPGW